MERLYTREDAMVLLGVKKSTLDKYVHEKRLKVSAYIYNEDDGRYHAYFSENAIEEFMGNDEGYNRNLEKKLLQREIEERLNRLLYLEQQEAWNEQFERDFFKGLGL